MKASSLLASIAVGFVGLSLVCATPALAQAKAPDKAPAQPSGGEKDMHDHKDGKDHSDHKHDKDHGKAAAVAKVGELAPAFELTDTDGKAVKLSDYSGKVVVLEWFNPTCPFVVKHHKTHTTFKDLHTQFKGKDVVFLAINSSAAGKPGAGVEVNKKAKSDWKVEYPIVLDESGKVGKAYGARTTPHCYVIDKKGILAYAGAIDDNDSVDVKGNTNYVASALTSVLAGQSVAKAETKPYGCSVKY